MIKLQLAPDNRMLAQFSWVAPLGFCAFGWLASRFAAPPSVVWSIVALGPIVLVAHLAGLRAVTLWVFRVLVLITFPIGLVVMPLLIGAIYYGLFTPMGLAFRAFGRDVMGRKLDKSMTSYWHVRSAERPASSYFKLY